MSSNLHAMFLEELCHEHRFPLFLLVLSAVSSFFFHHRQVCAVAFFVFCME